MTLEDEINTFKETNPRAFKIIEGLFNGTMNESKIYVFQNFVVRYKLSAELQEHYFKRIEHSMIKQFIKNNPDNLDYVVKEISDYYTNRYGDE